MVTLYHKGIAICAQKVRICLAEKHIAWDSKLPDVRDPEYLALNPNGYVPTLVHDGRIVMESRIICEYINDAFEGPELLPADPYDRARVALWTKQIDDSLHLNIFTLTFVSALHSRVLKRTPEEIEKILPFEVTKRDRAYDMIEKGFESKFIAIAIRRFARLAEDMERALTGSTWLVGETYSLADVDFIPYLQRIVDLGLGFLLQGKPNLQRWFEQVKARSSFAEVTRNWVTQDILAAAEKDAKLASPIFVNRLSAA
jgi:glutathione S-transferase